MCTAMLFDPNDIQQKLEDKLKALEEQKRELEEQIKKVSRKSSLFERLEEKLRGSIKVFAALTALLTKILHN
jgi:AMMECR1 domain-containing protein